MSLLCRSSALAALAIVAFLALGCGGTTLDPSKMEDQLEAYIENRQGKPVSAAECPSGIEVKTGATFDCTVDLADGGQLSVTVRIQNSDADTEIIKIKSGADK